MIRNTSNSYAQILRSSSIVGGAQAANYAISLVRVKIIAMLLGPTGVGLIGLYSSALGLIGTFSGLGLNSSAVREIVRANGEDDPQEVARTIIILRRLAWITGLFGWALAVLFCRPISLVMVGSTENASAVAWLGATLVLASVSSGQLALLQGLRRVGDLARANVLSAILTSFVSIALYLALGQKGIVAALIAGAVATLAVSWFFARRVPLLPLAVKWTEALNLSRRLIGLGVAFMAGALAYACVDLLVRSLVTRQFGVEGAGVYQAAWAISATFANFVLTAMATDFYPRLTANIHDRNYANRVVNEQMEIGLLLALPGLIAALAFSPSVIRILYSDQFLPAADLLPWMVLGILGQVLSLPLGYVLVALAASRWFAATQLFSLTIQALLAYWLINPFGLIGVSYAFALMHGLHLAMMLCVTRMLIGFSWSRDALELVLTAVAFFTAAFLVRSLPSESMSVLIGAALTFVGSLSSLRGLAKRLDDGHRLIKLLLMIPGGEYLFGTRTRDSQGGGT